MQSDANKPFVNEFVVVFDFKDLMRISSDSSQYFQFDWSKLH